MERFGAGFHFARHKEPKHIGVNTVDLTGTLIILGISLQGIAARVWVLSGRSFKTAIQLTILRHTLFHLDLLKFD
jgi:hypothetical protein